MAEPYMTPDMQAAGVNQPDEPMSQAGLVDALRSRGTLPSGLAQTMAPTGGANAGLAFGSGVLNALSGGNAALNPYLAQQQEQQNRQFWQLQSARDRAQRQEEKRRELEKSLAEGLLKQEDPKAQQMGAQALSQFYQSTLGRRVPPEYFIESAKLTSEEQQRVQEDIVANVPDAMMLARHPKLARMNPQWLATERQVMQDPAIRAKRGYKTDDELRMARVERENKEAALKVATWKAQNPDVSDKALPWLAAYVQEHTGLPLIALDSSNPDHQRIKSEGLKLANQQVRDNEVAWVNAAETERAHRAQEAHRAAQLGLQREELEVRKSEIGAKKDKPLSAEAAMRLGGVMSIGDSARSIEAIRDDPAKKKIVDGYIGPYASRLIQAQQMSPGGLFVGKTPKEVVDLSQDVQTMINHTINLLTGAAMSEPEAKRLAKQMFDMSLPPDQFWRRYENSKRKVEQLLELYTAAVITGDRTKLEALMKGMGSPLAPQNAEPRTGWGKAERVR